MPYIVRSVAANTFLKKKQKAPDEAPKLSAFLFYCPCSLFIVKSTALVTLPRIRYL
jgi:hypothetical protein